MHTSAERSRPLRVGAALALASTLTALLSGCSLLDSSSAPKSATTAPSPGPTWHYYQPGNPRPSATPAVAAPAQPSPSPTLTWLTPLPVADASHPACYGLSDGKMDALNVAVGSGSATVTWTNVNEPALVSYRVAAVPQDLVPGAQTEPTWLTVTPGKACAPGTVTFTGLTAGGRYVFWLDAVTKAGRGPTQEVMIGRSEGVQID